MRDSMNDENDIALEKPAMQYETFASRRTYGFSCERIAKLGVMPMCCVDAFYSYSDQPKMLPNEGYGLFFTCGLEE